MELFEELQGLPVPVSGDSHPDHRLPIALTNNSTTSGTGSGSKAFQSRYSNGGGGGGTSGRGNNRRRLITVVDDNEVTHGMERPPNSRHATNASAPTAEPSPLLLDAEAPPPVLATPPKLQQLHLPIVSSTVAFQSVSSSSVVEAMFPSSLPHRHSTASDYRLHSTSALPAALTDRIACDAIEMNSLLCADALDRPQHEWSSFSSSEDRPQERHNKSRNDAVEHALHDFGTAARATLATLPAGLIRRLMAKLFQA
jgi:hypothetical protein